MKFILVGSGSKGNASLIYTDKSLIQIDMGVPLKRIAEALSSIHREEKNIEGLFLTHEHVDHIGTMNLYHGRIPLFASEGTIDGKNIHLIAPGEYLRIGDFSLIPFSVSHDAANPLGYLISDGVTKLAYVTDTGYLPDDDLNLIKDCEYYVFESNHDLKMLLKSDRPAILKKRIHCDTGHLSNVDSATYMADLVGPRTKKIYLAHISEECNTPELALATYRTVLRKKGIDFEKIELIAAKQWEAIYGGD